MSQRSVGKIIRDPYTARIVSVANGHIVIEVTRRNRNVCNTVRLESKESKLLFEKADVDVTKLATARQIAEAKQKIAQTIFAETELKSNKFLILDEVIRL